MKRKEIDMDTVTKASTNICMNVSIALCVLLSIKQHKKKSMSIIPVSTNS